MKKTSFKKHRIKSSFFTKVFNCESGIMEFGFGLAWLTKETNLNWWESIDLQNCTTLDTNIVQPLNLSTAMASCRSPFKKHRIKSSFFTKVFNCESGIMEFGFGLAWLTKDCSYMAMHVVKLHGFLYWSGKIAQRGFRGIHTFIYQTIWFKANYPNQYLFLNVYLQHNSTSRRQTSIVNMMKLAVVVSVLLIHV
jgi:hypothetical protein